MLVKAAKGADLKQYSTPISYLREYCLVDCIIVVNALIKFDNTLGKLGETDLRRLLTISGTALSVFLSNFNNIKQTPLLELNPQRKLSAFFKQSYLGGRTEVFHSGMGIDCVYHFDVPGMYAKCMTMPLPIGNPVFVSFKKDFNPEINIKFLKELEERNLMGFFECKVATPLNLAIPVLPVKHMGKLVFPLGEFTGV